MSRLNWKRAKFNSFKATDLLNENEFRKRDTAARWLRVEEAGQKGSRPAKSAKQKSIKREHRWQGPIDRKSGLVIYTDGACEPNPGRGGWAFVVYRDGMEIHFECGGDIRSTNNVMEMTAVIKALEWLLRDGSGVRGRVLSDSQYVVKGCNEWRHGWRKRGWKRSGGESIKNYDLWKRLDGLLMLVPIKLEWVKGHAGILGNERADELSNSGRSKAIDSERRLNLMKEQLKEPA